MKTKIENWLENLRTCQICRVIRGINADHDMVSGDFEPTESAEYEEIGSLDKAENYCYRNEVIECLKNGCVDNFDLVIVEGDIDYDLTWARATDYNSYYNWAVVSDERKGSNVVLYLAPVCGW